MGIVMETEEHTCDVLVIGGGPGGSTVSTLLARKGRKVILLEKDSHPRFHIGESLLPMNMPILERLGVMKKVEEMGVVKLGADFALATDTTHLTYHFADAFADSPPNAYEVTRSEFDEMLFRNATANGVDTREEIRVDKVEWDGENHTIANAVDKNKKRHVFRARYLVDASGRDTFLGKKLGLKRRNPDHGSAAIFSHFKGVERRPGNEQGNISIYWFDHGWMWFIPLKNDLMSIGAVCHPDYLKGEKGTHEEILMRTLALCPAGFARLQKATRSADVRATGNYSYTSDRMAGPGYVMVGDAFAFIDPVFSSGVYLAMNSAERAAEVVDRVLDDSSQEIRLQREYDKTIRKGIGMFSWFIYRFTTPGMRWIFKNPRNIYRMQEAVTSMLAGDVFRSPEIAKRFRALKLVYAVRSAAEVGDYVKSFFQRRKNSRVAFDKGTLSVDAERADGERRAHDDPT
jgi:flavin-dependent dehydrogenase